MPLKRWFAQQPSRYQCTNTDLAVGFTFWLLMHLAMIACAGWLPYP